MKLGADHPDTLTSMNNLASTYMAQWRWEDSMACPDFRRSSCHRKIPLDLSIATVDVCQVSQARSREGHAGSCNVERILSDKVLFDGKVGKM
ncbi:hypothetical protein PENSUB_13794 [Penicillium subrubescens]|uniref:Uncharacterized protein n=1 Tax=Penicillium subrubescens TaxID=1316194 RepID=A0A1Q5SP03_9EURO|nr:hypothetical protein PENSUB_13794 [Penicillium subrubescens]